MSGLDSSGLSLSKEILPGSRPSLLDRRPKFSPLQFAACSFRRVRRGWGKEWGRGGEDCQIWWNDRRSLFWQGITNLRLKKFYSNMSVHNIVWAPCVEDLLKLTEINRPERWLRGLFCITVSVWDVCYWSLYNRTLCFANLLFDSKYPCSFAFCISST